MSASIFPMVATVAACGSLLTAVKSGWDLSRMARKDSKQTRSIIDNLRLARLEGLMNKEEHKDWYERLLVALAEKDIKAVEKVRAHIRLLQDQDRERRKRLEERTRRNSEHNRGSGLEAADDNRAEPPWRPVYGYDRQSYEVKSPGGTGRKRVRFSRPLAIDVDRANNKSRGSRDKDSHGEEVLRERVPTPFISRSRTATNFSMSGALVTSPRGHGLKRASTTSERHRRASVERGGSQKGESRRRPSSSHCELYHEDYEYVRGKCDRERRG